jgi:hypothetical protein
MPGIYGGVEDIHRYWPEYNSDETPNTITWTEIDDAYAATRSVAAIVMDTYDIPYVGIGGGELSGIDIKHMDAMSAIKMSLLEQFGQEQDYLREIVVNPDGYVEFIKVGEFSGNITNIYHTVQTENYVTRNTSVMITGKKTQPVRALKEWKNLIGPENGGKYWDTTEMVTNCSKPAFNKYATITFDDPHFDASSNTDNIESLYDVKSVFERVAGWVWYVDPGLEYPSGYVKPDTMVKLQQTSTVPLSIGSVEDRVDDESGTVPGPDLGTMIRRKYHAGITEYPECISDLGTEVACNDNTLVVEIPTNMRYDSIRDTKVDKFISLSKIFAVGYHIDKCVMFPKTAYASKTGLSDESNSEVYIGISDVKEPKVYELQEGTDYAVAYDTERGTICIQFANNAPPNDGAKYGTGVNFGIFPFSPLYSIGLGGVPDGFLTIDNNGNHVSGTGTVFPNGDGTAILMLELYAQIELDAPSVIVYDPSGNADEIVKNLIFEVAAITMTDEPAPIAINGWLVDQTEVQPDTDPTTVQDFVKTDYERRLEEMDGGNSVELNMSSLSASQIAVLSSRLYNWINDDEGIETTYVCGPEANPQLGGYGLSGGIVNNITYSYSDQGSYTISVTEGPRVLGLSGVSGGPYIKANQSVSSDGVIIQDIGRGSLYKVNIDGIGVRQAISNVPQLLRVGDKVKVTIHNNPVEA